MLPFGIKINFTYLVVMGLHYYLTFTHSIELKSNQYVEVS